MTNYRYLGYGVTDSNGVAKLDHDANGDPLTHSYTGVGAGEIDVLASLDNPISSGSIVSEPCNVWDCTYCDIATTGQKNTKWYNQSSSWTIGEPSSDGTVVSILGTSGNQFLSGVDATTWGGATVYSCPIAVEVEIVELTTGTPQLEIRGNNFTTRRISKTGIYRIEATGTKVRKYYNGELVEPESSRTLEGTHIIGFRNNSADCEFKYKNYKVYPI